MFLIGIRQFVIQMTLALTAGSMLIMWFSEQITEKGVGNGPSLLIFINIVAGLPKLSSTTVSSVHYENSTAKRDLFVLSYPFF